ncbi:uncharacterized protein LOC143290148 isoform X2 [Babylonia areolata]|uniref:uncharacterized protein LOC143290148 isoform X2 n=1 Tax=Babylonia areolata TaxID=304850 RepID=UPI003FD2E456
MCVEPESLHGHSAPVSMPRKLLTRIRSLLSNTPSRAGRHDTAPLGKEPSMALSALQEVERTQEVNQLNQQQEQQQQQRVPQRQPPRSEAEAEAPPISSEPDAQDDPLTLSTPLTITLPHPPEPRSSDVGGSQWGTHTALPHSPGADNSSENSPTPPQTSSHHHPHSRRQTTPAGTSTRDHHHQHHQHHHRHHQQPLETPPGDDVDVDHDTPGTHDASFITSDYESTSVDSAPFFRSFSEYPTVIEVCRPPGTSTQDPDIGTGDSPQGQAVAGGSPGVEEEEEEEGEEEGEEGEEEEKKKEEGLREEEVSEMYPQPVLSTPIGALRKSRHRLCLYLNVEMMVLSEDGLLPDYRGLAELVGFDTLEIANFWERNHMDSLLVEWARCRDGRLRPAVLGSLVTCLVLLGRYDVLEECRGLILEDVSQYLAEQQLLSHYSAQRLEQYDCYINIAEKDVSRLGREIVDTLEGVYGLRLCLTLRDIQLGGNEYENMAATLENRCNSKVLLVLTKNYEDSDACQFLMHFAAALDPCSRRNKLIPLLVDEDAFIPRVVRGMARLNYTRDKELGFLWPRLRHAITH